MRKTSALILSLYCVVSASSAFSADWPQWRGPQQNGIAEKSPKLLNSWPANGPLRVWETKGIAGDGDGGYGSVSVANGKAYLFVNWKGSDKKEAKDTILCLNAADGDILWKKEFPGKVSEWGSSSTPCIADKKVYVAGDSTLYCLKADNGDLLWKAPLEKGEVSSSPMVVDGVAVVHGGSVMGFDAKTGNQLWAKKDMSGNCASSVVWKKNGKNYLISHSDSGVSCIVPKTGEVLWTAPSGGMGTAVISGDKLVLIARNKDTGVLAYNISLQKAEKIWSQPSFSNSGGTAIISGNYVYGYGSRNAFCLSLADGKVAWQNDQSGQFFSPVLADNKLFGMVEGGERKPFSVVMYKASPEKYEQLASAPLGIEACTTTSICNGRMYIRTPNSVACYDLTKPAL